MSDNVKNNLYAIKPEDDDFFSSYRKRKKKKSIFFDFNFLPQIKNSKLTQSYSLINKIPKIKINKVIYPAVFSHLSCITDKNSKQKIKYLQKKYLLSVKYLKFLSQENLTEDFIEKISKIERKETENDKKENYQKLIDKDNNLKKQGDTQIKNNSNQINDFQENLLNDEIESESKIKEILLKAPLNEQIESLKELDNIPINELENSANFIIKNIRKEKSENEPPKLIIHNIFFEWIINNIIRKVDDKEQNKEVITVEYIIDLLNKDISNLKRNIINYVDENERLKDNQLSDYEDFNYLSPAENSDNECYSENPYFSENNNKNNKVIRKFLLEEGNNNCNSLSNILTEKLIDDESQSTYFKNSKMYNSDKLLFSNDKIIKHFPQKNALSNSSTNTNNSRYLKNISYSSMTDRNIEKLINHSNSNYKLLFLNNYDSGYDDFSERSNNVLTDNYRKDIKYISNKKNHLMNNNEEIIFEKTNEKFIETKKSFGNMENENINDNNKINRNKSVLPKIIDNRIKNIFSNSNKNISLNTDNKSLIINKNSIKNSESENFSEFYNPKINQIQNNSFSPNNTDRNNNPISETNSYIKNIHTERNISNTKTDINTDRNISNILSDIQINKEKSNKKSLINTDRNISNILSDIQIDKDNTNKISLINTDRVNKNVITNINIIRDNSDIQHLINNEREHKIVNNYNNIIPNNKNIINTIKHNETIITTNNIESYSNKENIISNEFNSSISNKNLDFNEEKSIDRLIKNTKNNHKEEKKILINLKKEREDEEEDRKEDENENEELSLENKSSSNNSIESNKKIRKNSSKKIHKSNNKNDKTLTINSTEKEGNKKNSPKIDKKKTKNYSESHKNNKNLKEEKEDKRNKILKKKTMKNKEEVRIIKLENEEKMKKEEKKINKETKIKSKTRKEKRKKNKIIEEDNYNPLIGAAKLREEQNKLMEEKKKKELEEKKRNEELKIEEEKRLENERRIQELVKKQQKANLTKKRKNPAEDYINMLSSGSIEHIEFLKHLILRNNPNFFNQEKFEDEMKERIRKIKEEQMKNEEEENEENEENEEFKEKENPNLKKKYTRIKMEDIKEEEKEVQLIYDNSYLLKKKKKENFELRKEVQDILEGKYKKKIIEKPPKVIKEFKYIKKKEKPIIETKIIKNPKKKLTSNLKTFLFESFEEDSDEKRKKLGKKREEEEEERIKQIRFEEQLKNFFNKIKTLKKENSEQFNQDIDKLLEEQMLSSQFGRNRLLENRINDFKGKLSKYVKAKNNFRKIKESYLFFKDPCEFETSHKIENSFN